MIMKIYRIKQILKGLGRRKIGGEEGLNLNKAALFEFMERYPVRKMEAGRQKIKGGGLILTLKPMPIIVGIIIATLLAGGGTAFASQGSLPGDALYPVKLMTEDIQTAVTWNPGNKVELGAKFANRRLTEIQKLQQRLKNKNQEISPEMIEKAFEQAEKKLEKVQERIAQMEEGQQKDKALGAASKLEEALRTHEQILSDLAGEVPIEAEQALLKAQGVAARHAEQALGRIMKLEKAKEVGEKFKEKIKEGAPKILGGDERAENKLQAIKNRLEALKKHIANLEEKGVEISEEAKAKLDEAKNKISEAESLFGEEKYMESFQAAHEAMKLMLQTKLSTRPKFSPRPMPGSAPIDSTVLPTPETGEVDGELAPLQQQNQYQNQHQGL